MAGYHCFKKPSEMTMMFAGVSFIPFKVELFKLHRGYEGD